MSKPIFVILLVIKLIITSLLGLGLEERKMEKKRACSARVAEAGPENIKTVHEPEPIQAADTL